MEPELTPHSGWAESVVNTELSGPPRRTRLPGQQVERSIIQGCCGLRGLLEPCTFHNKTRKVPDKSEGVITLPPSLSPPSPLPFCLLPAALTSSGACPRIDPQAWQATLAGLLAGSLSESDHVTSIFRARKPPMSHLSLSICHQEVLNPDVHWTCWAVPTVNGTSG